MNTELHAKTGYIYIIGSLFRIGTLTFATSLEHDYFPPDKAENELYNIFQIQYCGMPHYIIEVPYHSFQIAKDLAEKCGLRLVNGKPSSANPADPVFGLVCNSEQCFTLETIHTDSHNSEWTKGLRDERETVRERLKMMQTDISNEQEGH